METPEEEWDEVMGVNLKSVYLCSRFAIPAMAEQPLLSLRSTNGTVSPMHRVARVCDI